METRGERAHRWVDRVGISVGVLGLLMMIGGLCLVASDVKRDRDAARAEVQRLRDTLDRQVQGTGACDARLAQTCDGLWACDWRSRWAGEEVAKNSDQWEHAGDRQEAGLAACCKSYPKGAEYSTNP